LKLTDFGISKQLEKTYAITNTFVGTLVYMSPERINGKNYSYLADIWALGIILVEFATGNHPYVR
jgi:serine/threonine protein kinase